MVQQDDFWWPALLRATRVLSARTSLLCCWQMGLRGAQGAEKQVLSKFFQSIGWIWAQVKEIGFYRPFAASCQCGLLYCPSLHGGIDCVKIYLSLSWHIIPQRCLHSCYVLRPPQLSVSLMDIIYSADFLELLSLNIAVQLSYSFRAAGSSLTTSAWANARLEQRQE